MPFRRTEMASNGVKSDTASMTSESEVKRFLKPSRNIKIMADRTTLMRILFPFTTKMANFATLG